MIPFISDFLITTGGGEGYMRVVAGRLWREKINIFFIPEKHRYFPFRMGKEKKEEMWVPFFLKGCVRSFMIPEFIFRPPKVYGIEIGAAGSISLTPVLSGGVIATKNVAVEGPILSEGGDGFVLLRGGGIIVLPCSLSVNREGVKKVEKIHSFSSLLLKFKEEFSVLSFYCTP